MKNLQIQCESPAIILNPHLKDLVLKYRHYYFNGFRHSLSDKQYKKWYIEFPYSLFSKVKKQIQCSDELDNYYIHTDDEDIPLFYFVPCGKCLICRDKKANEWVSRAMCETQTSTNIPYFITLTYNNLHTPKNGVRKRAVQLFMKRLRINFSRLTGEVLNLRFFLCAEYGSKTQRPHYHALLWNVPNLDPNWQLHTKLLHDVIQRSWSFMVSKKRYDELPSDVDAYGDPIYKYYDEENKRYRGIYGYVKISECNEHRVRYCMKYMRKDSDIPSNCNDVFFLSSRRRGLGYDWINSHVQEFRDNPSICDILLTDKFTGEKYQGCIPRYFKDIIAPPPSKLISKDIRDTFKLYNYMYNKACTLIGCMYTPNQAVLSHFPILHYHLVRLPLEVSQNLKLYSGLYLQDNYDNFTRDLFNFCDSLEYKLLQYEYDVDLSTFVPEYKKAHLSAVELLMSDITETIPDKIARLKRNRLRSLEMEQL